MTISYDRILEIAEENKLYGGEVDIVKFTREIEKEIAQSVVSLDVIRQSYKLGFLRAAAWADRDDLFSDLGSPAYIRDMESDLSRFKAN